MYIFVQCVVCFQPSTSPSSAMQVITVFLNIHPTLLLTSHCTVYSFRLGLHFGKRFFLLLLQLQLLTDDQQKLQLPMQVVSKIRESNKHGKMLEKWLEKKNKSCYFMRRILSFDVPWRVVEGFLGDLEWGWKVSLYSPWTTHVLYAVIWPKMLKYLQNDVLPRLRCEAAQEHICRIKPLCCLQKTSYLQKLSVEYWLCINQQASPSVHVLLKQNINEPEPESSVAVLNSCTARRKRSWCGINPSVCDLLLKALQSVC